MGDSPTPFEGMQTLNPGMPNLLTAVSGAQLVTLTFDAQWWHGPLTDWSRWTVTRLGVPQPVTDVQAVANQLLVFHVGIPPADHLLYESVQPPFRFHPNNSLGSFQTALPFP